MRSPNGEIAIRIYSLWYFQKEFVVWHENMRWAAASPCCSLHAPRRQQHQLTFVTGSCLLKAIEAKVLNKHVRSKNYRNAKLDDLQDSLSNMDEHNLIMFVFSRLIRTKCWYEINKATKYASINTSTLVYG